MHIVRCMRYFLNWKCFRDLNSLPSSFFFFFFFLFRQKYICIVCIVNFFHSTQFFILYNVTVIWLHLNNFQQLSFRISTIAFKIIVNLYNIQLSAFNKDKLKEQVSYIVYLRDFYIRRNELIYYIVRPRCKLVIEPQEYRRSLSR